MENILNQILTEIKGMKQAQEETNTKLTNVEMKVDKLDARLTNVESKVDKLDNRLIRVEVKQDIVAKNIETIVEVVANQYEENEREQILVMDEVQEDLSIIKKAVRRTNIKLDKLESDIDFLHEHNSKNSIDIIKLKKFNKMNNDKRLY